MKRFLFLILLLSCTAKVKAQSYFYDTRHLFDIGVGLSSNIAVYELGLTTKFSVPIISKLSIEGELSYFPGSNNIKELYTNLSINFSLLHFKNFSTYAIGGFSYNKWFNNPNGEISFLKSSGGSIGIGSQYTFKNTSLFMELKTNSIYLESTLLIGVKQSIYATFKKQIIKTRSVRFL